MYMFSDRETDIIIKINIICTLNYFVFQLTASFFRLKQTLLILLTLRFNFQENVTFTDVHDNPTPFLTSINHVNSVSKN